MDSGGSEGKEPTALLETLGLDPGRKIPWGGHGNHPVFV